MSECGVKQPCRTVFCERTDEHDEHRATATPGHTYCYWTGDDGGVRYRVGAITDPVPAEGIDAALVRAVQREQRRTDAAEATSELLEVECAQLRTTVVGLEHRLNEAEVLLCDALFYVGAYQRNPKAEAIADELSTAIHAFLAGVPASPEGTPE